MNTRVWLRELGLTNGPLPLQEVPESALEHWQRLGFTHIWLMGVWSSGPLAREIAANQAYLLSFAESLPGGSPSDIGPSPYAISGYTVDPQLGGEAGLASFRERLRDFGLKLILDFIPNHTGLDHPWLRTRPDLFVQTHAPPYDGYFAQAVPGRNGPVYIAHGRDPHFDPWVDTAQLDYRNAETREAMLAELKSVARRCDGVRCDMAMLVLPEVFAKTWGTDSSSSPGSSSFAETAPANFWVQAIPEVKRCFTGFMFLAEVYWGLEPKLQELGFDYTYDKDFYDRVVSTNGGELMHLLLAQSPQVMERSAHFLENHDEPRAAATIGSERMESMALLMLALPGMRLLHQGQLDGCRTRLPVQMLRKPPEADAMIVALYEKLLHTLRQTCIGHGNWRLLKLQEKAVAKAQGLALIWESDDRADVAMINASGTSCECEVELPPESMALTRAGRGAVTCNGSKLKAVLPPFGWVLLNL